MSYLLDTNACIELMNRPSGPVVARLKTLSPAEIRVCAVTRGELLYGALRSERRAENFAAVTRLLEPYVSYPFDDACAHHYAGVRADLAHRGTPIGPNDLLIAAVALAHDLVLVTHNTREFGRVVGLRMEDWQA